MSPRKDISNPMAPELDVLGEQKFAALTYIQEAWEEALCDGLDADLIAHAALFAALSDLVETYGEEAVAQLAKGLARRIERGEFTLNRNEQ